MSTLISVVRVKVMERWISLSFLVGYCEIMQRWGPLGAHNSCLATGSPPGCGDCSLPLTNNNLTSISTSEYSFRNLPLAFPLCSPAVVTARQTDLHQSNTQYTASSHSVGGLWVALRPEGSSVGTSTSIFPKRVTLLNCFWVREKCLLCGLWRVSSTDTSHSAEHSQGNIQLRLLKQGHKLAN